MTRSPARWWCACRKACRCCERWFAACAASGQAPAHLGTSCGRGRPAGRSGGRGGAGARATVRVTWPAAGVNLMALERRLSRICRRRKLSATKVGGRSGAKEVVRVTPWSRAWLARSWTVSWTTGARVKGRGSSTSCPASILEKSRMSPRRRRRSSPDSPMRRACSAESAGRSPRRRRRSAEAMMPLRGVRISWLMLARKSPLARAASLARAVAASRSRVCSETRRSRLSWAARVAARASSLR